MKFIDQFRDRYGVKPICTVLTRHAGVKIAPSTYYAFKSRPTSARTRRDSELVPVVRQLHERHYGVYGIVKMWHALKREGHVVGRDHVARLMRLAGVHGVVRGRKPVTTVSDRSAHRFPDLVKRGWDVTDLNTVWVADFTYVRVPSGFVYVAFITDVASRRILGWNVDTSRRTSLVTNALNHALMVRRLSGQRFSVKKLIHHSDAGTQYTSSELKEALSHAGVRGSIGTVGDALDNALMESAIGLYKTELIHARKRKVWGSVQEVETRTAEWVDWFNTMRVHSSIGYQTPTEFENNYHQQTTAGTLSA